MSFCLENKQRFAKYLGQTKLLVEIIRCVKLLCVWLKIISTAQQSWYLFQNQGLHNSKFQSPGASIIWNPYNTVTHTWPLNVSQASTTLFPKIKYITLMVKFHVLKWKKNTKMYKAKWYKLAFYSTLGSKNSYHGWDLASLSNSFISVLMLWCIYK